MNNIASSRVRPVLLSTRLIFIVSAFLAFIAGIQLYILTDNTAHYFAWTINQPLSAAFLGAGYWTGVTLLLFSIRERAWANIRIALAAVSTFAPLLLIVTLLHLDRFHFNSDDGVAVVAAWAWILVYLAVPFLLLVLFILQLRTPGGDPPRLTPIPLLVRVLIGANAAISFLVGGILLIAPQLFFNTWPWELTPLAGRAIGVGFLSIMAASAQFIRENEWSRGRVGTVPYMLVGVLQLFALIRYPESVMWDRPGSWLYVLFMLGVLGGGLYSTIDAWRPRSQRA